MCLPDEPTITRTDEENNRLSTVLPDLATTRVARFRDYPSGKFAPKRKSDSSDAEKANERSDRVDLEGKLRIPSNN